MVQVVERGETNQVLASAALSSVSSIKITSATGNTSLTVDTAPFGNAKAPADHIHRRQGQQHPAVTGAGETDWAISGATPARSTSPAARLA